jgi:hypothetical protein
MPQSLLCLDADVRPCAGRFRSLNSESQEESFVSVLRGLRHLRSASPWMVGALVALWPRRVRRGRKPVGEEQRNRQRQAHPKRRGRPYDPFRIGDASAVRKPQGYTMEGTRLPPAG